MKTTRTPITLPGKYINGIHVTDLFIRFSAQVVVKGWVKGENREAIFIKARAMAEACEVKSSGCMVLEPEDQCGAFEFEKDFECRSEAVEYCQLIERCLL